MRINIISMSGGKDSTALALLALERKTENLRFVFADTGHEQAQTYNYLDYLESALDIKIERVKADFSRQIKVRRKNLQDRWSKDGIPQDRIDGALEVIKETGNPFLDLLMLKGRFPSTRARFCSSELKHIPISNIILEELDKGNEVYSWQGVRAEESPSRAKLDELEAVGGGLFNYRPILKWTWEEVFAMHDKHQTKPNPLYKQGMGRVGCMPCIHCKKSELKAIASRFPEEIERVSEWERLTALASKRGMASFFSPDKTPQGRDINARSEGVVPMPQVWEVVEWSKTGRGGRMMDLFADEEAEISCSSEYGLCE